MLLLLNIEPNIIQAASKPYRESALFQRQFRHTEAIPQKFLRRITLPDGEERRVWQGTLANKR